MSAIPISFRVDEETAKALERLAEATDHEPAWHLRRALKTYLDEQLDEIEDIRRAVAEADAGDFATDEEAEEAFASFANPPERP